MADLRHVELGMCASSLVAVTVIVDGSIAAANTLSRCYSPGGDIYTASVSSCVLFCISILA